MKLLSIIGTRPQFIKLYPIYKAINDFNKCSNEKIKHIVVNTGQHFDRLMSDVFLEEMDIDYPEYSLNIVEKSQCSQVGKMIMSLERVLLSEAPDIVLVYGDTNSTLAGALATKKLNFKLAHIEAGLRSFNRNMQEEINRITTDKISDILFCPTENALKNLKDEGFLLEKNNYNVYNVGDVMYDAFLLFKEKALSNSEILNKIFDENIKKYILVTIHRAENTDNIDRLNKILGIIENISDKIHIIFPIHPRTKKRINSLRLKRLNSDKIKIIEPVSYFDMLKLESKADFIITDSGGVQKEAYFFNKICITLREETEWIETLEEGCNYLINLDSFDSKTIAKNVIDIISKNRSPVYKKNIFGNGDSSTKSVRLVAKLTKG